jgi:membrane associated rhomboid family serine protease
MALLDDLLRLFGTSRVRLRWKWDNWKRGMNRTVEETKDQLKPSKVAYVPRHKAGWRRFVDWAIPAEFPIVTVANIVIVIGLYVVMVKATHDAIDAAGTGKSPGFKPGPIELVRYGLQFGPLLTVKGEWWRMVTAVFLHLSLLHVILNVVSLWVAGQAVEELFGRPRTIVIWVVTGIAGFAFSLWWREWRGAVEYTAGASGAVFGLIGAVVGHVIRHRGRTMQHLKERFIPWLLYGLLFSFVPAVNGAAHVGGLLAGMVIGALIADTRSGRKAPEWIWRLAALACVVGVAASFYLAYRSQSAAQIKAEVDAADTYEARPDHDVEEPQ